MPAIRSSHAFRYLSRYSRFLAALASAVGTVAGGGSFLEVGEVGAWARTARPVRRKADRVRPRSFMGLSIRPNRDSTAQPITGTRAGMKSNLGNRGRFEN